MRRKESNTGENHPYRYALVPTSQFYFCGIPFRLDTSPKCPLNCSYCFAMSRGGRRTSSQLLTDPSKIQRKINRLITLEFDKKDIVDEFLLSKMPVHFGGMSDPFGSSRITTISTQILQTLNGIDYPVVISTKKTNRLLEDDILQQISKMKNLVIQISFSLFDGQIAKVIEPGVPSPIERLKALRILNDYGIYTIARLQPIIPTKLKEIGDFLIPMLGEVGVKHVILEFLKLPVEQNLGKINELFSALSWDGISYYKGHNAEMNGREWMLPVKMKWELLQPLIEKIHMYGMTYGAGDYGLNHLGDTNCCCGLDNIEGFGAWNKINFSNIIRNSRTNVIIFDNDLFNILPKQSVGMYINSNSRIPGENSLYIYMRNKWNRPGTTNAPDSYFGISWKGDYDEEGNCVYSKDI